MNRQCALRYLIEAKKSKQNVLENIKEMLKFVNTLRRNDLEPIIKGEFTRTYNIRILLTKNFDPEKLEKDEIFDTKTQNAK